MTRLRRLVWFTLSLALVSLFLSAVVRLWIDLPWWTVFRRCVSVSTAVVLWLVIRYVPGESLSSLGLGSWRPGRRQIAQGALLGVGVLLALGMAYLATGVCRVAIHPDALRVWRVLLSFIPLAGLIAFLEELVFRGFVLQQLLAWSKPLAIAGSSAAYALVHLKTTLVWPNSGFELVGLFILGWVLALSRLSTGQLYVAIGLHAALAYGARVNKLLIAFTESSPQWLVGTSRLVNGVTAWLALLGVGWIVARWAKPLSGVKTEGGP